mgnify:CR=1 FL=1
MGGDYDYLFPNLENEEMELTDELTDALRRAVFDQDDLVNNTHKELIEMVVSLRKDLKEQANIMELFKENLKSCRSVDGYFWVFEYHPQYPPVESILSELQDKYLGGEPLVGLPAGSILYNLSDKQLASLGLRRHMGDESSRNSYEAMLKKS